MNRKQEHLELLQELSQTPTSLDGLVARAKARKKKRTAIRNFLMLPTGAIALVFAMFVAMVNISSTVASAMEQLPGLRRLAEAVSFTPSLVDAVEQGIAHHLGLSQTINDVTITVEYVIVDERHVHVFYTLEHSQGHSDVFPSIGLATESDPFDHNHTGGEGMGSAGGGIRIGEPGELQQFFAIFHNPIPSVLYWRPSVTDFGDPDIYPRPRARQIAENFEFRLEIDPYFVLPSDIITLDYDFIADNQHLTITTVEINPTHMRVNFSADENNTARLRRLRFFIEDENGRRFSQPGIESALFPFLRAYDSMMLETHFLESAFFAESEHLAIVIEEIEWLDKKFEYIRVDFEAGTAGQFPEHIRFVSIERDGQHWILNLEYSENGESIPVRLTYGRHGGMFSVIDVTVNNLPDTEHVLAGLFFSTGVAFQHQQGNRAVVYMTPQYSHTTILDAPIVVAVR